jgi:hypothetical protein
LFSLLGPFLFGVFALRLAVAPLGDAIATAAVRAAPALTPPAPCTPDVALLPPAPLAPPAAYVDDAPAVLLPRRIASRSLAPRRETVDEAKDGGTGSTDGGRAPASTDAPRSTIVVPAAVVTRALERRDVGATNATTADGAPLGARLAGVGKYKTGLRDGDVVVTVAGTRTPTVEAMVSAAMAAATSGATRISGRIMRGDATYAVVLELPRQ